MRIATALRSPPRLIAAAAVLAALALPVGASAASAATHTAKTTAVTYTYWLFLGGGVGAPVQVKPGTAVPPAIDTPDGTILNECGHTYTMQDVTYQYSCWPTNGASLTIAELDVNGKTQQMGGLAVPFGIGWTQIPKAPAGELYANCLEFNPVYGSTALDYVHIQLTGPNADYYVTEKTGATCVSGG